MDANERTANERTVSERTVCETLLSNLLQKLRENALTEEEVHQIHSVLVGDVCSHDQAILSYLFTGWYIQTHLQKI